MTSGYQPLERLSPLRRVGHPVGRLHPLSPIPPGTGRTATDAVLFDVAYGIEGDGRAARAARSLIELELLRGNSFSLVGRPSALRAYHAGASLLSGGLVALFHLAEQVMAGSVRRPGQLRAALAQLAWDTLFNVEQDGPALALTGALARGSDELVRGHLRALQRAPRALEAYRVLGVTMLELARSRGSIDASTQRRLARLLRAESRRG